MISTREVSPRTNTYHHLKEVYLVLLLQRFFKTIHALLNYDCMHKFLSFLHIRICLLLYDQGNHAFCSEEGWTRFQRVCDYISNPSFIRTQPSSPRHLSGCTIQANNRSFEGVFGSLTFYERNCNQTNCAFHLELGKMKFCSNRVRTDGVKAHVPDRLNLARNVFQS